MADEDPWGTGEDDTPAAPEPTPAIAGGGAADGAAAAATAAGGVDERPEAEVGPQDDPNFRRPVTLYRHWVRPKFLQYKYMEDYRTNYYNDVIDYLDKRSRGVSRDVPRAQTWAERVLRTHTNSSALDYYRSQKREDKHLIQTIASSIKTHNYHTKAYINRKYSSVL